MTIIQTTCLQCGKTIQKRSDRKGRFCSPECWYAHGKEIRRCEICGNEFQTRKSKPKRTCSDECWNKLRSIVRLSNKAMMKHTKEMGKANKGKPSARKKKPIQKTCKQCHKLFVISRSRTKETRENQAFCSTKCWYNYLRQNPSEHYNWRGGDYERNYGRNWGIQKRKARRRDNSTCQRCGITQGEYGHHLDVHHKIPFRNFGIERYKEANNLKNLITLCRRCHMIVENSL